MLGTIGSLLWKKSKLNSYFTCCHFCHVRLCDLTGYSLPGSSVHGLLQARVPELVAMPSSKGSSNPGIEPQASCFAARFFTAEPPGKNQPPCVKISTKTGEGFGEEWIHVYVCLSPFPVHLKLPQHCWLAIQNKKLKCLGKKSILGLPGGWVVRTPSFHFRGYGFNPGSGN